MRNLHIDFETASLLDLRKVGTFKYFSDPSTVMTVVAWAFDNSPPRVFSPFHKANGALPKLYMKELEVALDDEETLIHAWNVQFEQLAIIKFFKIIVSPERLRCTMQRSLYAGYPGSLETTSKLLTPNTPKGDSRLMMRMSRPRSQSPLTWWHETDHGKLMTLMTYCRDDVIAERAVSKMLPPLPPAEQRLAILDNHINGSGLPIDINLVNKLDGLMGERTARINAIAGVVTQGEVTSPGTQTAKLLAWFEGRGLKLPDLKSATIEEARKGIHSADIAVMLGARADLASASVKKLAAFRRTALTPHKSPHPHMRYIAGAFQFYGAGRTGRWAGRLIQPQNFPRPTIKKPPCDAIADGKMDLELLELLYGDPTGVLSSCLRGCITAPPGSKLVCLDFAQIEARILALLAGQEDILEQFAAGNDVYTYAANGIGSTDRQLGKVMTLALGYGMGKDKFIATAQTYGITLTEEMADTIVKAWRKKNDYITSFWKDCDRHVREGVTGWERSQQQHTYDISPPNLMPPVPRMILKLSSDWDGTCLLTIRLPSGRKLFYRDVRIENDPFDMNQFGDAIMYSGVHPISKQWARLKLYGGKIVEHITQATARDVMASLMLRKPNDLVGTVHDELIYEKLDINAAFFVERLREEAIKTPAWLPGLPIAVDIKVMQRYGK